MKKQSIRELGESAVATIENQHWLDRASLTTERFLAFNFQILGKSGKKVQDLLHGTWLGHPLHPALTDIPLGSWTAALILDLLAQSSTQQDRQRQYQAAADATVTIGIVGAIGSAVTGLADWQYLHAKPKRLGLAHGLFNSVALALYGASLYYRRRGQRSRGMAASTMGYALAAFSGYLGGNLVYRHRIGVDRADPRTDERGDIESRQPGDFVRVMPECELPERKPRLAILNDDVRVVLVRRNDRIYALGDTCSHLEAPLSEGWLEEGKLVCPWHGSKFCLEDGHVIHGPATFSQPCFETRIRDGYIEVRSTATKYSLAKESIRITPEQPLSRNAATQVLVDHHQVIRHLIQELGTTPRSNLTRRQEILDQLMNETEIHEQIEEEIFYPAIESVISTIPIALSEHRQMNDRLALLKVTKPSDEEFDLHLMAFRDAIEHHVVSEEHSMFIDALVLGSAKLEEVGIRLLERKEELTDSRFHRAARNIKNFMLKIA